MPPKSPIRCFEGSTRPYEPFWTVRDAADGGDPELEFYGFISEYAWLDDDITPKKFKDDLYKLGAGGPVTVRLNSGGGEVIAASVIRSILADYPGQVTVRIDGLAASAAVIVAMAGDRVLIQDTAYMMIHDPGYSMLWGWLDIDYLTKVVDQLKAIKDGMLDVYQSRTGMSRERLGKMLTNETWLSAKEAVNLGFADQVVEAGQKNSALTPTVANTLKNYVNVPAALLAQPEPNPEEADAPAMARLRAEIQLYL